MRLEVLKSSLEPRIDTTQPGDVIRGRPFKCNGFDRKILQVFPFFATHKRDNRETLWWALPVAPITQLRLDSLRDSSAVVIVLSRAMHPLWQVPLPALNHIVRCGCQVVRLPCSSMQQEEHGCQLNQRIEQQARARLRLPRKVSRWLISVRAAENSRYLAISRLLIAGNDELLGEEMFGLVLYITLPTAVCTVFACALARILLLPSSSRAFKQATLLATSALVVSACGWTVIFLLVGGVESISEVSLAILLYAPLTVLGCCASPCFTFLMLRIAKYRFIVPSRRSDPVP